MDCGRHNIIYHGINNAAKISEPDGTTAPGLLTLELRRQTNGNLKLPTSTGFHGHRVMPPVPDSPKESKLISWRTPRHASHPSPFPDDTRPTRPAPLPYLFFLLHSFAASLSSSSTCTARLCPLFPRRSGPQPIPARASHSRTPTHLIPAAISLPRAPIQDPSEDILEASVLRLHGLELMLPPSVAPPPSATPAF